MNAKKTAKHALLAFTISAGLLAIAGCLPSDDDGGNNGGGYDSLHIPRALLRDTGEIVYQDNCNGCHGPQGQGDRGPQVANSSFIMDHREQAIQLILRGNAVTPPTVDSVWVNGVLYLAGGMPQWHDILSDHQIAGVLTYIRSVLNDTLVTNCNPDSLDANNFPICDRTARSTTAMDLDSVAVWEVKAVRDTIELVMP